MLEDASREALRTVDLVRMMTELNMVTGGRIRSECFETVCGGP